MTTQEIADKRAEAVTTAMHDVRAIETELGVTRPGVEAIRDRLLDLAARRELFPLDDFPVVTGDEPAGTTPRSRLYRLAQDDDDRFALYAQRSSGDVSTPAHNHTTWAVVVGFEGRELNRFYRRTDGVDGTPGVTETHQHMVEAGTGVAMLPDDLHSIHIEGPALNFHCYGLALEKLHDRVYFDADAEQWRAFSSVGNITDARQSTGSRR